MKINRKFKLMLILTLSIIMIAVLSGCKDKKSTVINPDGSVAVRVGHFANITHSQALVGRETGQFEKALDGKGKIEWKVFNAGPSEIEALFAGELDIAYIGPGPAINGYSKSNGDLKIIAGATNGGAVLVSRKDLKINELTELSGKRLVVPQFGNTQDLSLRNILNENGLKDETKGGTVQIRQASNADIKTLLGKGDVDAALVPEPWGSVLVKDVNANIILDNKDIWRNGEYSTALILVRTEFLKENPEIVENFIRAHVEVTDYINSNIDKAKEIVNKQISDITKKPLSKDILNSSFERLTVTYDPEKDSVVDFIKLSQGAGYLKSQPDTENMFDFTILNKILKEKGKKEIE